MAAIFLDTSALVRRYDRSEPGAARVRAICAPTEGHAILMARLAPVEVASALARKVRDRSIRPNDRARLWRLFRVHWRDQYQVLSMTEDVYVQAQHLLFRYALRTLDAIHIGCALAVVAALPGVSTEFWTADRQQASAARAEGLTVEFVA